jgi:predicted glycogen debranching enzyme
MNALSIGSEVLRDLSAAAQREWLVTNGLGGYAAGSVAGMTTRRYHGLLVAALRPPLERTVMVAKVDATVAYQGQRYSLGSNEYADGTVHPGGYLHLESFQLQGQVPVWRWRVGDALIEQRVWMAHGQNTSYLSYTLLRASAEVELALTPLCTYRDYHWQLRGERNIGVDVVARGVVVQSHDGARSYRLLAEHGDCSPGMTWHWNLRHRAESERGLDDLEDLFCPARFCCVLAQGESTALIMTAEETEPLPAVDSLTAQRVREAALLARASQPVPSAECVAASRAQLVLAADQFIVERRDEAGRILGATVIAGYPWFSDWGRDTMIALPGLALATGRPEIAQRVLRTFAHFVSQGMLPNRFPDGGEAPEYNTVDATLWFVVAVEETLRRHPDRMLLEMLYPVLVDIIHWHRRGTRYGIRVDAQDGLLLSGEPGVQLTWMDAKIGDWVVTPRTGKAVEINALWFNALSALRDFSLQLQMPELAQGYAAAADRVRESFCQRFWYEDGSYLYDVIDAPQGGVAVDGAGRDASVRPNQLFAVSLRHPLLSGAQARAVVDRCARDLWTPVGLRSLSPHDSRYVGTYGGGPAERDAAYHQGTVWSWLTGAFVTAHYRVYGNAALARSYLADSLPHLRDACVGQVSEIFDGDLPHRPRGCFAQAWGVAETLRAWSYIDECEARDNTR